MTYEIAIVVAPLSGDLADHAMRVDHELRGGTAIEGLVALQRLVERNDLGIHDIGDRQVIMQDRHHQLAIIATLRPKEPPGVVSFQTGSPADHAGSVDNEIRITPGSPYRRKLHCDGFGSGSLRGP